MQGTGQKSLFGKLLKIDSKWRWKRAIATQLIEYCKFVEQKGKDKRNLEGREVDLIFILI
jgi:hypothetical protein